MTLEKKQTNAASVTMHPPKQALWGDIWKHTLEMKQKKCNQCDYASSDARNLRKHLKTHSEEKSKKCRQCDYSSPEADNFSMHLKNHSEFKSILELFAPFTDQL